MTTGLLGVVESAISVLNKERNVHFKALPQTEGAFQSDVALETETITLIVDCRNGFPDTFPVLSIKNPLRFYPHVDEFGKICLFEESAIIIRTDLPDQIMLDAFDRAVKILEIKPGSPEYKHEVAREFNAYWIQSSTRIVYTNLDRYDKSTYKELKCVSCENSIVLSETVLDSEYLLQNYFGRQIDNKAEIQCTILRLRNFDVPPIQKQYSWKQLRCFIMKNITGSQKRRFQKFLNQKMKVLNRFIILSIPSEDQDFLVGFWIHYQGRQYYKVEKNTNCHVEPIMTVPIDYEYMLKRGGGGVHGLKDKSVLLIGCGSIGGYIAANLCQVGVGSLDILDDDYMSVDNVHRHILGFSDALKHKNKADLVKEYLENQYPHVDIDSLNYKDRSAETFLDNPSRLRNYDLIISATGEPQLNLSINKILYGMVIPTPFIVCFNEPYGIGGHAMAVNIEGGCLECLYTDIISDDRTSFRGSFVTPEQDFNKSISGCAGSFVVYSALDSQQTAVLAMRLATEVLSGECKKNQILSWYSSSSSLMSQGYAVSDYYKRIASDQAGIIRKSIPRNERCRICKSQAALL